MTKNQFVIIYRFLNQLVIELIFVGIQRPPPPAAENFP